MKALRCGSRVALVALAVAILTPLAVAPAAMADKPAREILPAPEDMVITDQCDFPVLAHIEGVEIDTTFTDKSGNPVKLLGVFPGNKLTVTNLDTRKSITVGATGAFHGRLAPDGSGFFMVTGLGPVPSDITGEPGLWYLTGRLSASFDAEGNLTSINVTGKVVDLCERLAS